MVEENISQKFRLKNIVQTRNHFLEEIDQNESRSSKHKKVCTTLNYTEHFIILACTITGCISIFVCFFDWLSYRNCKFCNRIKNFWIAAEIKKYMSILKKKKEKHDIIVLLGKYKLDNIEVLISKTLIYSNISHGEFFFAK